MKVRRLLWCALLVTYAGVSSSAQSSAVRYSVSFPHINLQTDRGERIEAVGVIVQCGRFAALDKIPNDWSATVVSPVSEKTTLRMEAGHGTSELWHSEDLDGFVTVLSLGDPCFDIRASVTASYYQGNDLRQRKILFHQHDLILRPES